MFRNNIHVQIKKLVKELQKHTARVWYPPLIGFLALLDNFIIIIPNDGILISSSMLQPKKWFALALWIAVGSTIGAILLATLVELQGLPWILEFYPGVKDSKTWTYTIELFEKYGLLLVFLVAVTPLMQQPAVIMASLANTPLFELTLVIFVGRFIKFLIMAYVGSHTPRLLGKLWGLKDELEDVGVQIDSSQKTE